MTEHLLAPVKIGSMTVANRIAMAPMGVEIVGDDGMANDEVIAYYEARAAGGAGLLITEVAAFAYPHGVELRLHVSATRRGRHGWRAHARAEAQTRPDGTGSHQRGGAGSEQEATDAVPDAGASAGRRQQQRLGLGTGGPDRCVLF